MVTSVALEGAEGNKHSWINRPCTVQKSDNDLLDVLFAGMRQRVTIAGRFSEFDRSSVLLGVMFERCILGFTRCWVRKFGEGGFNKPGMERLTWRLR